MLIAQVNSFYRQTNRQAYRCDCPIHAGNNTASMNNINDTGKITQKAKLLQNLLTHIMVHHCQWLIPWWCCWQSAPIPTPLGKQRTYKASAYQKASVFSPLLTLIYAISTYISNYPKHSSCSHKHVNKTHCTSCIYKSKGVTFFTWVYMGCSYPFFRPMSPQPIIIRVCAT